MRPEEGGNVTQNTARNNSGRPGATVHSGGRRSGMVGRAVFSARGDNQSGVATGAAPRSGALSALSDRRGGHRPTARLDAPLGAGLSAAPPADPDARGAPVLERQDDPAHPGASQDLCHLGAHAPALPVRASHGCHQTPGPRHRAGGRPGAHRGRAPAPARCRRSAPGAGRALERSQAVQDRGAPVPQGLSAVSQPRHRLYVN